MPSLWLVLMFFFGFSSAPSGPLIRHVDARFEILAVRQPEILRVDDGIFGHCYIHVELELGAVQLLGVHSVISTVETRSGVFQRYEGVH